MLTCGHVFLRFLFYISDKISRPSKQLKIDEWKLSKRSKLSLLNAKPITDAAIIIPTIWLWERIWVLRSLDVVFMFDWLSIMKYSFGFV